MSTSTATIDQTTDASRLGWLSDYFELTKPRIVAMELITIAMGYYLAVVSGGAHSLGVLMATLLGTGLVAGSASALNQWLERELDSKMSRTQNRPIPAGRVNPLHAVLFGVLLLIAGSALLLAGPGVTTFGIGFVCWCLYVVIYTPLKTRSTLNTAVGAASGALPIIIGWSAGGGGWNLTSIGLFGVLYLWQYPHFMAIAWRCRDDYKNAGYVMSTTVDPTGRRAGIEAIVGSVVLGIASLLPLSMASSPFAAAGYVTCCLLLVGVYGDASVRFFLDRNQATSRRLLLVSLLYLPCWLIALFLLAV